MKKIYIVYHGWVSGEKVTEFDSKKKALAFIEKQKDPDEWCFDIERRSDNV